MQGQESTSIHHKAQLASLNERSKSKDASEDSYEAEAFEILGQATDENASPAFR